MGIFDALLVFAPWQMLIHQGAVHVQVNYLEAYVNWNLGLYDWLTKQKPSLQTHASNISVGKGEDRL